MIFHLRIKGSGMNKKLEIRKTIILIFAINMIQLGTLAVILLYSAFTRSSSPSALGQSGQFLFMIIVTVTSLINSFISIRDTYLLNRTESQYQLLKETITQVENLNKTLRAQRHDFLNHLQVVFGLIEMGEYLEANQYIEKVYNDIQKVSRALKTSNPAVNALLQVKTMDAEKRGMKVEILVSSQLDGLSLPSWEMCKVLGNLIDNAIDSLEENTGEKILTIKITEDLKSFGLMIGDNGPGISEHLREKIFEPGFSTKGNRGEGMGLAIVKETLAHYGGCVKVSSTRNQTFFEVTIPK